MFIESKELQRLKCLKDLDIKFDRNLCGFLHISRTTLKVRKGLVAIKTMAASRMSQKILVILNQALILSVINYVFGILTLSAAPLKRLESIKNEAMRTFLGCTKDTASEAMRYLLGFPTMAERRKHA